MLEQSRRVLYCIFATGSSGNARLVVTVCAEVLLWSDVTARTPLTSMFLPGCNMHNQNRVATSENAFALHY